MMKKRRFSVALILAAMLLLSACADASQETVQEVPADAGEEKDDGIRIGITFDTFVLERWTRDRDVFMDTARKMGATVDVQTANGDVEKQKEQVRKFTEENMDAIVIVATDCYSLKEEVEDARNKGIQVISYDRLIQGEQTDLYITVDNEKVGTLMAQSIKEKLPEGGNVVMICGPEADSNSMDVANGFETELGDGPWKIVYKSHVKSWTPENGTQAVADAFAGTEEEIDAVMCGNDGLAGYVIRSLSERQLAGDVVVVGQDADLEACQRIVEGTQTMTVYKPINDLAKEAAECTVKLARGEQIVGNVLDVSDVKENEDGQEVPYYGLEPVAVTAENMDSVIIGSGFHSREEVYLNVEN
ncbi:sugar ABC transporter substrate-binding protein [Lachnoclostridium phocaeense]|uniref:sugar ABC transporter substrate-binding protein n=1 Tax=Lachnoclostridium phocaeense TaxID=1871021 RepID=UPI00248DBA40|nr:substrate-binding domain-containing protein [Lachnoclostridium phocaeense]